MNGSKREGWHSPERDRFLLVAARINRHLKKDGATHQNVAPYQCRRCRIVAANLMRGSVAR